MPLTVELAREIANQWRERFCDQAAFEESWARYWADVKVPDVGRLEAWLSKDLEKDKIKHAGIVKEPLLPVRQNLVLGDCDVCCGKYFVRHECDIDHPDFGKAFRAQRAEADADVEWWMWALIALGAWIGVSVFGGVLASRLFRWLKQ